jgi:hypothetical protein
MDVSELKSLAEQLAMARETVNSAKEAYEELKKHKDMVQANLLDALKECEVKSIKTENCFFSMVTKQEPVIIDSAIVTKDLISRGIYEDHLKLDTAQVKSTAKALLKEHGEVMDGMEISETEYISIRNNK